MSLSQFPHLIRTKLFYNVPISWRMPMERLGLGVSTSR